MHKFIFCFIPVLLVFAFAEVKAGENEKLDSLLRSIRMAKADSNAVKLLQKAGEEYAKVRSDSCGFYLDTAVKLAGRIGFKRGEAASLMGLANFNSINNRYKIALDYNLRALALMEELGNASAQAKIYRSIGTTYYGIKDFDNALKNYQQGLAIAQKLGMKTELPGLLSNIGIIWHQKRDYGKAMENYIAALKAAEANGDKRSRSY